MSDFYLFRGQQLIDKFVKEDDTSAGGLYDSGQEGDVLVEILPTRMQTLRWRIQTPDDPTAWQIFRASPEEEKQYLILISLQA